MANNQRMKNDIATDSRREDEDRALSKNRDKNDALTQERRFKADETMVKNRAKNDEMTVDRRIRRDANDPPWGALALFFLVFVLLATVAYFIFI